MFKKLNLRDPYIHNLMENQMLKKGFPDVEKEHMPNAIAQHPRNGAQVLIGGVTAANNKAFLKDRRIFNIVCAKGGKPQNLFHKADPKFTYHPLEYVDSVQMM